ncbi:MAG TPA: SIMPL domain-containing protein [Candidatus Paceibacterota bacterium]|nr:SIMPL domain-containing protein [Candidatus Paceibacterota bacterium]
MARENFFDRPFVIPSILLSIAFFAGLALVAWGIAARGQGNTITVTGSASEEAKADTASMTVDLERTAYESDLANASAAVSRDANAVASYFKSQNLASSSVRTSVVSSNQNYSSDKGTPTSYSVRESVTFETSDVDKADALSHDIASLNSVAPGSVVSLEAPQYYISSLPELRISLLGAAIKDAKARASQIAQSGGSSVGALSSAASGVVQVLAPNSTDVEGYGEYDTSTIKKVVMVTAHATFYVR